MDFTQRETQILLFIIDSILNPLDFHVFSFDINFDGRIIAQF